MTKRRKGIDKKVEKECLHDAPSYLQVPADNEILRKGNLHSYCKVPHDFDKIRTKPSILRKIYYTFF